MRLLGPLVIAASIVGLDQLVKHWAIKVLSTLDTIPVIQGVLHLTYTENTGAAFSILEGKRWFLVGVTFVVLGMLIYFLIKDTFHGPVARLAISLILGGAVGNMLDRMRTGFVVDMFELRFIRFAIFNVADIFLTMGAVLLIFWVFYTDYKERQTGKAEGDDSPSKGAEQ